MFGGVQRWQVDGFVVDEGVDVGAVELHYVDDGRVLTWRLYAGHSGHGHATRALRLLARHVFTDRGLYRLEAEDDLDRRSRAWPRGPGCDARGRRRGRGRRTPSRPTLRDGPRRARHRDLALELPPWSGRRSGSGPRRKRRSARRSTRPRGAGLGRRRSRGQVAASAHAQAERLLPGVRGLAFVGFLLHRAATRAPNGLWPLARIELPTLSLQGTRDVVTRR